MNSTEDIAYVPMYQMYPHTCILIYVNAGESNSQISSNFQGSWQSQNLLVSDHLNVICRGGANPLLKAGSGPNPRAVSAGESQFRERANGKFCFNWTIFIGNTFDMSKCWSLLKLSFKNVF